MELREFLYAQYAYQEEGVWATEGDGEEDDKEDEEEEKDPEDDAEEE